MGSCLVVYVVGRRGLVARLGAIILGGGEVACVEGESHWISGAVVFRRVWQTMEYVELLRGKW